MSTPQSQQTVYESSDSQYGLFYWIYIKRIGGNLTKEAAITIAKSCSRIQETAQRVNDPTGLKVGIGFGKIFLEKIEYRFWSNESKEEIDYYRREPITYEGEIAQHFNARITEWEQKKEKRNRLRQNKSENLNYPTLNINEEREETDGDIFVHAKGNSVGTLYEFQRLFIDTIPADAIDTEKTSLTRGFTFQNHRDVSGYILGIANPVTSEERRLAAVIETGGSYVLTQKWEHNRQFVKVEKPHSDIVQQDKWIGRTRDSGKILNDSQIVSHVNLMKSVGHKIVRQSLPYSEVESNGPTGLFFLAYANNTQKFDDMLNSMAGNLDNLFFLSKIQRGTYWYFPGMEELDNLNKDVEF